MLTPPDTTGWGITPPILTFHVDITVKSSPMASSETQENPLNVTSPQAQVFQSFGGTCCLHLQFRGVIPNLRTLRSVRNPRKIDVRDLRFTEDTGSRLLRYASTVAVHQATMHHRPGVSMWPTVYR
jgi:hypothetical protein